MLGITPQYRGTLRNYIIGFGSLFDDIDIQRKDSSGNVTSIIRVPLSYGPAQKYISRINAESSDVAVVLPRMSFEISGISYDSGRKLNKMSGYTGGHTADGNKTFVYNPVPWDISLTLSLLVKNAEDGTQILEQILPFFTPSFIVPIKEVEELDIVRDTPVILESVDVQDTYEGDYLTRRVLEWTLGFTLKGYLYGSQDNRKTIKKSTAKIVNIDTNRDFSHQEYEIDPTTATELDDYGFSASITEFNNED